MKAIQNVNRVRDYAGEIDRTMIAIRDDVLRIASDSCDRSERDVADRIASMLTNFAMHTRDMRVEMQVVRDWLERRG